MLGRVHIRSGEDLSCEEGIRRFVDEAFDWDAILYDVQKEASREPLVVVKPNWVQESHALKPDVWAPVITNADLILSVIECVATRFRRDDATICVCDAPHGHADFPAILSRGHFGERFTRLASRYPGVRFELLDLRREVLVRKGGVVVERRRQAEDPRKYVKVDMGKDSLFYGHPGDGRYYGADYDSRVVNRHHNRGVHEYLIAGTAMACDLFINVPKMKTHQKTGITCCLKNLVGISGEKNWLPHHTEGGPDQNGDEFPQFSVANRFESVVKQAGKRLLVEAPSFGSWMYRRVRRVGEQLLGDSRSIIRNGNWSGNDTCWRMALDLNRALLYYRSDGSWRQPVQPKLCLNIVDGIIGGQGDGPLCPDPIRSNVLIAGINPAEVDAVVARLMGFDPERLPIIREAFAPHRWPITRESIRTLTAFDEREGCAVPLADVAPAVGSGFRPHFGWSNLVDRSGAAHGLCRET